MCFVSFVLLLLSLVCAVLNRDLFVVYRAFVMLLLSVFRFKVVCFVYLCVRCLCDVFVFSFIPVKNNFFGVCVCSRFCLSFRCCVVLVFVVVGCLCVRL